MSQQINETNDFDEDREITSDEYFTPPELIQKHMHGLDPNADFIDNNAGIGNWLVILLEWKLSCGINHSTALTQLYGIELNDDTAEICRIRLLKGNNNLRSIVDKNIITGDCLKVNYRFDGLDPYETENDKVFNSLFE
jgi:type I restriction-modification system DNA methylase subunit